jgi:NAD-dependent SIR2 family protein deacetylase
METLLNNLKAIEQIADILTRSRSILFITGAGISADSGLPMRAAPALDAIWRSYRQRPMQ